MRLIRSTSRAASGEAARIEVDGGRICALRPAAHNRGTTVELRDLFCATPARLKFLRGDRAETQAIAEVVRRLGGRIEIGASWLGGAEFTVEIPTVEDLTQTRTTRVSAARGEQP